MRKCYLMDDEVVVSADILRQRELAFQSLASQMSVKPGSKQAQALAKSHSWNFVRDRVEHEKAVHPDEASLPSVREALVDAIVHCCNLCRTVNADQGCMEQCDKVILWRKALEVEARS